MSQVVENVFRTIIIVWLMASTGYVLYDLYENYLISGVRAAYQQGYADSVSQVIGKVKGASCQPIEVRKGDESANIIDASCQVSLPDPGGLAK